MVESTKGHFAREAKKKKGRVVSLLILFPPWPYFEWLLFINNFIKHRKYGLQIRNILSISKFLHLISTFGSTVGNVEAPIVVDEGGQGTNVDD